MAASNRGSVDSSQRAALRVAHLGRRGRGVLADERILVGMLLERAPVLIIPHEARPVVDPSNVGNYIFLWEHDTVGEDIYKQEGRAAIVLGFASLVNHAATPNCAFVRQIDELVLDVIALRDIEPGEEITFDYGMSLWFTPD